MPLSEHEQRQLEQIEQALRADAPQLARVIGPKVPCKRRVIAAALGFLIGVGLLLAGVVINVILIAVAGSAVMLASSLWAVTGYRRMTGIATGPLAATGRRSGQERGPGKQAASGLGKRREERWRRRQQGDR